MLAPKTGSLFVFIAIDRGRVAGNGDAVSLAKAGDFWSRCDHFGGTVRSSDASFHGLDWKFTMQHRDVSPVD
ncbi:hypothetical protein GT037_010804 [Alternaria burnsii]|uniref:Uncharacterized protein n=1 Tax=Alternaria burnsii TaxID=1187904 RepID=A0A8H7E909_9PLEO|nr:uncharacterized protein GT037_010804 [Alternaria burnsii]KAF7671023.1 hypothetical protein GT037_010804 [Alternaria burnsii]